MSAKPRRHLAWKILLAVLSGLVALEVSLRVVDARAGRTLEDYAPTDASRFRLYQPHPFIGYVLRPGTQRDRQGYAWNVNSLGFRGPERKVRKPDGVYRVFCLGGSTTFGTGATSDAKTYPAQLERMLDGAAPEGLAYEVWNCGVSGYTTAESLVNLSLRLLAFQPDAVLVYHAANDARPIQSRGFRPDYTHARRAWTETELSGFERALIGLSRTYAWLARGGDVEEGRTLAARLNTPNAEELRLPPGEPINAEGIATYVRNLRSIVAVARSNGVTPVLSTFATCRAKGSEADLDHMRVIARMNAEVERLAGELGVPCVAVAAALTDRAELFDDWMHLNDAGSREHAAAVFDAARAEGLFGLP